MLFIYIDSTQPSQKKIVLHVFFFASHTVIMDENFLVRRAILAHKARLIATIDTFFHKLDLRDCVNTYQKNLYMFETVFDLARKSDSLNLIIKQNVYQLRDIRDLGGPHKIISDIVLELLDFLISCVDVGTAPHSFIPGLTQLRNFLIIEHTFLCMDEYHNELFAQTVACLCFCSFYLSTLVAPSYLRVSHTLAPPRSRPNNLPSFYHRVDLKLRIIHSLFSQLSQTGDWPYIKDSLFFTSDYFRQGKEVHFDECEIMNRSRKFFLPHNKRERIKPIWVPYEPAIIAHEVPRQIFVPKRNLEVKKRNCCLCLSRSKYGEYN